ncbi:MAG: M20/M25/M40 family metallo-hydrolase [Candidatus Aminicenantes bacterium]|nr:M20/M25/M40 family metallo-hydrolase [Candidatus Aminicenantes bacterium]
MKRRILIVLVFALVLSPAGPLSAQEKLTADVRTALDSIQPLEAYSYCKTLSSETFAGRLTGHEGYAAAAKWAAAKFKQWGLKPIHRESGYLQPYPSPYVVIDRAEMTLLLEEKPESAEETNVKEVRLEPEKEFLPLLFSDSGDRTGELVFVGWGISAPDLGYDDYAGVDVAGKFVLCFRGTPGRNDRRFEPHDHHRARMKTAKEKGAFGLIYIYDEIVSNPNGDWIEGFMPAEITSKVADWVLKEKDITAAELRKDLGTYKKPLTFPLRAKIHLKVEARPFPQGIGYNIVGYVEGSDAKLRQECLVIGGHFDHNGFHMGLLFPGANDNASGSAAVMEIAEAFSKLKKKPKRSVVFALFGGEEMGLQGSSHFVEHIPPPFSNVDTMFNFDMVGEGDGSGIGYSGDVPELKTIIEEADQHIGTLGRTYPIRGVGVGGSDHAPFYQKGIPVVSFHSNGPHLHYHQTGDTIYRINPDMIADVAKLAFLGAYARASR